MTLLAAVSTSSSSSSLITLFVSVTIIVSSTAAFITSDPDFDFCSEVLANQLVIMRMMEQIKLENTAATAAWRSGVETNLSSIWSAVKETQASVARLSEEHFDEIDRMKQTLLEVKQLQGELATELREQNNICATFLRGEATEEGGYVPLATTTSSPPVEPTEVVTLPQLTRRQNSGYVPNCPVFFFAFGSQCFQVNTHDQVTWDGGRQRCREMGGDLADPLDPKAFLDKMVEIFPEGKYWLGSSDREHEGKWLGVSGRLTNMSRKLWETGEPNNRGGSENCLQVGVLNHFNDNSCDRELNFVCEHPPL